MTEETAKFLAEAMTRLANAIEKAAAPSYGGNSFHVYHHGQPTYSQFNNYPYQQGQSYPNYGGSCGMQGIGGGNN